MHPLLHRPQVRPVELSRRARGVPVWVRLVKGAYWDTETVASEAEGWPVPVFAEKVQTDANYERCVRMMHDAHGRVKAAFASHNLRSIAHAIAYNRLSGGKDEDLELQILRGDIETQGSLVKMTGESAGEWLSTAADSLSTFVKSLV